MSFLKNWLCKSILHMHISAIYMINVSRCGPDGSTYSRRHTHNTATWITPAAAKMFSLKWHLKFQAFQLDVWKSHSVATGTRSRRSGHRPDQRSPPDVHRAEITAVSTVTKGKHRTFIHTYSSWQLHWQMSATVCTTSHAASKRKECRSSGK